MRATDAAEWRSAISLSDADINALPERLTLKAMFFYMRAIASVAPWRFAIVSPMHSLKLLLGTNRVLYKGEMLHRPSGKTAFILVPCALITQEQAPGFDLSAFSCKWVSVKHGS